MFPGFYLSLQCKGTSTDKLSNLIHSCQGCDKWRCESTADVGCLASKSSPVAFACAGWFVDHIPDFMCFMCAWWRIADFGKTPANINNSCMGAVLANPWRVSMYIHCPINISIFMKDFETTVHKANDAIRRVDARCSSTIAAQCSLRVWFGGGRGAPKPIIFRSNRRLVLRHLPSPYAGCRGNIFPLLRA